MPNHITTEVEISGPKDLIDKLIKDTKIIEDTDAEKNQFDFNGIVKMPDGLHTTVSPTDVVATQEEADKVNADYFKNMGKFNSHQDTKAISQAENDRRIKEYGAVNWYDWASRNWGTKWNAYDVKFIERGEEKLVLKLDTAWDTPREIWDALEAKGYTVKGVMYGEMDGYDFIGEGSDVFEAYQTVEVEYVG
jgi:hypothetical protein